MYVILNNHRVTTNADIHKHFTRGYDQIYVKKNNLKRSDKCPEHAGALLYNKLPGNIKSQKGDNFKNILKQYLLNQCFYKISDFLNT